MSEFYIEQLVKVKKKWNVYGTICIAIAILVTLVGMIIGINLTLIGVVFLLIGLFAFPNKSLEYEYLMLNNELDIDKIIGKRKRKKVFDVTMEEVIVIAKETAGEVKPYQKVKTKNYTSNTHPDDVYKVVFSRNGEMEGFIFEPNEKIIEAMKLVAPRKIYV